MLPLAAPGRLSVVSVAVIVVVWASYSVTDTVTLPLVKCALLG